MFTDETRAKVHEQLRNHDVRAFGHLLNRDVLQEAAKRACVRIRKCPLNVCNLVFLGIVSAWNKGRSFSMILGMTLKLLQDQEQFAESRFAQDLKQEQQRQGRRRGQGKTKKGKHDPRGSDLTQVTEEAFVEARKRMPLKFWITLIVVLGERFEANHGDRLRFQGFRLLALDGTRLTLPDEKALRAFYGTASNGKGVHNAQARMVLLQSPLTRMPIAYDLQPVKVGEVTMARGLTSHLRADDLLLLDSGYFSYGLLWDIQRRQAFFCLRVQRRMNLRTVQRLDGTRDRLVCWSPRDSRGQWRKEGLPKSIDLRLIEYRVPGHRTIKLLTNVLSAEKLSYDDFTRLTTLPGVGEVLQPGLYHLRWQIETSYAELKVQMGLDGGLRSRKPPGIEYEVAGHVVLYLLLRWLIVEAAEAHGLDPLRISFSGAVHELQLMWTTLVVSSSEWIRKKLLPRLLERIAAHVVPLRPGRSYPRKNKKKKPTGKGSRKKNNKSTRKGSSDKKKKPTRK